MATVPEAFAVALQHHEAGRLQAADEIYRQILVVEPNHADTWHLLGVLAYQVGRHEIAIDYIRRAIGLSESQAAFHNNLGSAYLALGENTIAMACYRKAAQLNPDFAEAHVGLGNTFQNEGKLDDAVACFCRAVELKPGFAMAHYNLGNAFTCQGNLDGAIACYGRALALNANHVDALYNLANALQDLRRLDEAVACYRRLLEINPDHAAAQGWLVHQLQHMCHWENLGRLAQRVLEVVDDDNANAPVAPVSPFTFLGLSTITTAQQQLRCARRWADRYLTVTGERRCRPESHRSSAVKSKITIGYLSGDFHGHATAWLMAELFEKHDRGRFAIFGYSYGPDDCSPTRKRLVSAFDRFVDAQENSSAETASRIAADEVDILVDLKGYTAGARMDLVAFRPAPIQVNYLGYPGTMGTSAMDYILVDDFIVPADQQPFYTEKLVHLPGCYQVNDSQREIAEQTPSRAACGLPEKGFVFCSFNNSYKITPAMFDVWMRLLKAVPGSVLWLLEGNRFVPDNLRREAQRRGVAAERLVFAPRMALAEHLARHRLADLFLDTLPYNSHTTASDALWAGCPVLTLAGETFASRVAGSLLRAVGLPELITTSFDEYYALALRLAEDAVYLAQLRARLAANRMTSPLFDGGQFARNLEKAFLTMWKIHASGEEPRAFAVDET